MNFVALCLNIFSFREIMTRWDCDVKLWRDVPHSFPAFHGWPVSGFDIVLSSTSSLRYICCRACFKWVPESSIYHACTLIPGTILETGEVTVADEDSDEEPRQSSYVVSTEDNSESQTCSLCKCRMRLEFLQDAEEWVFMDCVEHEGIPVHEFCRDTAYG